MNNNNDITNAIAILGLILAILSLVISTVAPVLGALTGLIIAAYIAGGATALWAARRLRR